MRRTRSRRSRHPRRSGSASSASSRRSSASTRRRAPRYSGSPPRGYRQGPLLRAPQHPRSQGKAAGAITGAGAVGGAVGAVAAGSGTRITTTRPRCRTDDRVTRGVHSGNSSTLMLARGQGHVNSAGSARRHLLVAQSMRFEHRGGQMTAGEVGLDLPIVAPKRDDYISVCLC